MTTSATAVAAAAVAAEEETRKNLTSTTTCSKVLYNNAHCGQPVVSSSVDYCTHHRPDRIPCPVDPRHFVSTKGLKKHIGKCNATKKAAALAACPFFSKGINKGRGGAPTALETLAQEEAARDLSGTRRPRLAPGRKRAAEEMGHDKLLELLERVRKAAEEVLPPLPAARKATLTVMAAAAAAAKPLIYSAAAARPTSLKHDSQNDGIVSIALEAGVFGSRRRRRRNADGDDNDGGEPKDSSVAVVELGAGRGYLGAAVADALVRLDEEEQQDGSDYNEGKESPRLSLKCYSLTLVDRRAYRNKAERHYRSFIGSGSGEEARRTAAAAVERRKPPFELCRATVNLEDVVLSSLPGVAASASMALLGKHLCGSATDLSLRAAVTQLRLSTREGGEGGGGGGEQGMKKESGGEKHSLSGIAVATCCHHCCSWSDFAGKREFLGLGFTADEFEVVSQASAWATGGHGRPASKEKREKREKKRKSKSDDDGDCSSSEQEEDDVDDEEEEEQGIEGETALQPRCWQSRIPIADRRAAGDAAKRLLDGCRVRWLKRQAATRRSGRRELGDKEREKEEGEKPASSSLLVVEAREYAPEGMTGENRLIVAVPRGGGRRTEGGSFKVQPKK